MSSSGLPSTDAYVVVTLGGHVNLTDQEEESGEVKQKRYEKKTKVCRRTLNPVWDEEFRFDVSNDALLQDEPLIFKVYDADALATDESIGLVYIDLNPLLTQTASLGFEGDDHETVGVLPHTEKKNQPPKPVGGVLDGFFPLYDTLDGVRGELELSVKLNFIGDVNPFRDSSAGYVRWRTTRIGWMPALSLSLSLLTFLLRCCCYYCLLLLMFVCPSLLSLHYHCNDGDSNDQFIVSQKKYANTEIYIEYK